MHYFVIPIKLSKFPIALVSWTKRQGEVTSHSRSYGEELQRGIFVQIASAIGNLESAIGITIFYFPIKVGERLGGRLKVTMDSQTVAAAAFLVKSQFLIYLTIYMRSSVNRVLS